MAWRRPLVALLSIAAVGLTGCGGGGSSSRAPEGPSVAHGPAMTDAPFRCPDPSRQATADHGSDVLPTGATAVLLCHRAADRIDWVPPAEALTDGAERVVSLVDRQRVHHDDGTGCAGVGAPQWTMVFRYAGGTRTISGDNGGCWSLAVGSTSRYGSQRVYDAFLAALLAQQGREHLRPVGSRVAPACPRVLAAPLDPLSDPRQAMVGRWCRRDGAHLVATGAVDAATLAQLRRDITGSASRTTREMPRLGHCQGLPPTTYGVLVARDDRGQPLSVDFTCDVYGMRLPGQRRTTFVRMLPRTAAAVAHLTRS